MTEVSMKKVGLPPIIDQDTEVLILGSLPSDMSLSKGEYYGNPGNDFWKMLTEVLGEPLTSNPYEEQRQILLKHKIGLWDVCHHCVRPGSMDKDITEMELNDFALLKADAPNLKLVCFNGKEAGESEGDVTQSRIRHDTSSLIQWCESKGPRGKAESLENCFAALDIPTRVIHLDRSATGKVPTKCESPPWNCQMGLDKKADALLSLNPDLVVVPECSEKSTIALRQRGFNTRWFGSNPHKGLGVICRQDWALRALPQPAQKWIAPIEVDAPTPFTLIAVWACVAGEKRADRYIGQVYKALTAHPEWFDGHPVVLAGDLNSNKIWDAERAAGNHSDVVKLLEGRGLVSAYHEHFHEKQGEESRPTIYFRHHEDKPYHIDYIFIPREWAARLKTVEVGEFETWSKLSDHCPVAVEVAATAI